MERTSPFLSFAFLSIHHEALHAKRRETDRERESKKGEHVEAVEEGRSRRTGAA